MSRWRVSASALAASALVVGTACTVVPDHEKWTAKDEAPARQMFKVMKVPPARVECLITWVQRRYTPMEFAMLPPRKSAQAGADSFEHCKVPPIATSDVAPG